MGNVKSGKRLPKGYYVVDTHTNHPYIRVIDMRQGYVDRVYIVSSADFMSILMVQI